MARSEEELKRHLSGVRWGEDLARRLWRRLLGCAVGQGHVAHFHRDYCGHGLIRTADGVMLCGIQDGDWPMLPPIAAWREEAAFVAFFARQTDLTCAGWDAAEPVFHTLDPWARANQTLRREEVLRFVGEG